MESTAIETVCDEDDCQGCVACECRHIGHDHDHVGAGDCRARNCNCPAFSPLPL